MICVDELRECRSNGKWRWKESCHLLTDDGDMEALHEFAIEKLGLKRSWFHERKKLSHYDLVESKRIKAILLGAREVTLRSILRR